MNANALKELTGFCMDKIEKKSLGGWLA